MRTAWELFIKEGHDEKKHEKENVNCSLQFAQSK